MVGATCTVPTPSRTVWGWNDRIRQEQNHVRVVVSEPAVLGEFLGAARVGHADVRSHNNVRRARILGWFVVVQRERRAVINLSELDSGRCGIRFEDADGGQRIGRIR